MMSFSRVFVCSVGVRVEGFLGALAGLRGGGVEEVEEAVGEVVALGGVIALGGGAADVERGHTLGFDERGHVGVEEPPEIGVGGESFETRGLRAELLGGRGPGLAFLAGLAGARLGGLLPQVGFEVGHGVRIGWAAAAWAWERTAPEK